MSEHLSPALPRVALVTGAARRIGRSVALGLAEQGFDVAVHCRESGGEATVLVDEIRALGRRATRVVADLAETGDLLHMVDEVAKRLGSPGVLVNNASVFEPDSAGSLSSELWDRHMSVNLKAPVFLAERFARHLPPEAEGVIVNIADQRVWRLNPNFFSYTLSKSALWTATQTLAQSFAPRIRVMAIGPGATLPSTRQDPAGFERQQRSVPLRRGPGLDEITAAIRFILATPSLTGQMIALDGGQHLAWETPDVVGITE